MQMRYLKAAKHSFRGRSINVYQPLQEVCMKFINLLHVCSNLIGQNFQPWYNYRYAPHIKSCLQPWRVLVSLRCFNISQQGLYTLRDHRRCKQQHSLGCWSLLHSRVRVTQMNVIRKYSYCACMYSTVSLYYTCNAFCSLPFFSLHQLRSPLGLIPMKLPSSIQLCIGQFWDERNGQELYIRGIWKATSRLN